MTFQHVILLIIIGLSAGLLGGLLGIGGAIIIIPSLVFFLAYSQQTAQGTVLLMLLFPIGALGTWQYYIKGFVDVKAALILAAAFFISSYFGAKLAVRIPQDMLKKAFAILLIILAVKVFFDKK
jgi:uncharacterized membrane protein YfcA